MIYLVVMQPDSNSGVGVGQNMRFSDIVIDDPNLSMSAKGVFATLGLMGNECAVTDLVERTRDAEPVVRGALEELSDAGYVELDGATVRVQTAGSFGIGQ